MADEFVDFYEALNLSPETESKDVRKRINEVYLEAQRNLEHRDFQTRVKHQEMFEVLLPRARYILLDENRRADYDALVRAFRGTGAPAAAPTPVAPSQKSFGEGNAAGFRLAEEAQRQQAAGKAPRVEGIPLSPPNAQQMAEQRDEMWSKWKVGLETAIARDEGEPQPAKPTPPRPVAPPVSTKTPASDTNSDTATRKPRPQAAPISFNFGENNVEADPESARATAFELERQKVERKRAVMHEILSNIGLKGALVGGFGAAIPLGALLIFMMGHYYPRIGAPLTTIPSPVAWLAGLAIVAGATIYSAIELSKSLRHKAALELSTLPVEELLRKVGRSY